MTPPWNRGHTALGTAWTIKSARTVRKHSDRVLKKPETRLTTTLLVK